MSTLNVPADQASSRLEDGHGKAVADSGYKQSYSEDSESEGCIEAVKPHFNEYSGQMGGIVGH